jgi:acyl-coenzyme A thioesterase PaaI-like protein
VTPESLRAEGWIVLKADGFSGLAGTFWTRGSGAELGLGFLAEPQHRNGHMDSVHGGMLLTFADICLGYAVTQVLGGTHCVTAQLQMHFVSAARVGDFVSCRPEVVRHSAQLVFMRGLIRAGERTVASVDGIWKILEPRPQS